MRALEGSLGLVSLSGLLQLAQGEALSGRLVLEDTGSVGFVRGRPVDARCGELQGELALMELFVKQAERFWFDPEATCSGEPLGDVIALMMDGCRLTDDWVRTRTLGLALGDGVQVPPELASAEADLRAGYALEVVGRRSGVPSTELVDIVLELVEAGDAQLVPAADPPLELTYWDALELGRQRFRAGDYAAAVRAFEHAVRSRPEDRIASQNLRAAQRRVKEPTR